MIKIFFFIILIISSCKIEDNKSFLRSKKYKQIFIYHPNLMTNEEINNYKTILINSGKIIVKSVPYSENVNRKDLGYHLLKKSLIKKDNIYIILNKQYSI